MAVNGGDDARAAAQIRAGLATHGITGALAGASGLFVIGTFVLGADQGSLVFALLAVVTFCALCASIYLGTRVTGDISRSGFGSSWTMDTGLKAYQWQAGLAAVGFFLLAATGLVGGLTEGTKSETERDLAQVQARLDTIVERQTGLNVQFKAAQRTLRSLETRVKRLESRRLQSLETRVKRLESHRLRGLETRVKRLESHR
jgi:hypothetical protein